MSFYTCFDWFKKLRLFVNVQDRKQWRRKELIKVHARGFIFLLQDIWVPGFRPERNLEYLIYR